MKIIKDKSDWVVMIVSLCIIQLLSLWCIDMSVAGMINNGNVVNGLIIMNPAITYHVGLYLAIISLVVFAFVSVHHVLKDVK